jgi:putative sigma-54 modulation protein
MNVNVHSIHFDADNKLVGFIRERLQKLTLFHDRILSSEVFLRLEHDGDDRRNKVVEVKMAVPGRELFAKRQSKSFEEATDQAAEAIRRQLERSKVRAK